MPPQNTPPPHTQPNYSQDLLAAIGRIEGNVNDLSQKQDNAEQETFVANTLKQQKNVKLLAREDSLTFSSNA